MKPESLMQVLEGLPELEELDLSLIRHKEPSFQKNRRNHGVLKYDVDVVVISPSNSRY